MSDGEKETRKWKDRAGTVWHVERRENVRGLEDGWILRRVGFSLVAHESAGDEPTGEQLQSYVDAYMGEGKAGTATARIWTDPRSGTEWEVHHDAGEIVFRRGVEVLRASRGDGRTPPRSMTDAELQEALDRAQSGE